MPPLQVTLEFKRVQSRNDPHQVLDRIEAYELRDPDGSGIYTALELDWGALAPLLDQLQRPDAPHDVSLTAGQMLQDFVWPSGWLPLERRIIEAAGAGGVLVEIRSEAAELYGLPWELLRLRSSEQALGSLPGCSLRYAWTGLTPMEPRSAHPGRVVFAWSAAQARVPAQAHVEALEQAGLDQALLFDAATDMVPNASLQVLVERLTTLGGEARVLHLLCHGTADGLQLNGVLGEPTELVTSDRLAAALAPFASNLSLIVLCACQSGDGSSIGNRLSSVAQALHKLGVPAVVASRFPLSVAGSITLTQRLYATLAEHPDDIDGAVSQARHALAVESGHIDHLSVQLYAQSLPVVDTSPTGPPVSDRVQATDLATAREQPWLPLAYVHEPEEVPPSRPTFGTFLAIQATPTFLLWLAYLYLGVFWTYEYPDGAISRGFSSAPNWGWSWLWPPVLAMGVTAAWNPMRDAWVDLLERGVIRRKQMPEEGSLHDIIAEDVTWLRETLQWYRNRLVVGALVPGVFVALALGYNNYQLFAGRAFIDADNCCRIYSERAHSMACHFSFSHLEQTRPAADLVSTSGAAVANVLEVVAQGTWVYAALLCLVQMSFHVAMFARFEKMPRIAERQMRLGLVLDGSEELGLATWNEEYTRFCALFCVGLAPALTSMYNSRFNLNNPGFSDTDFYTAFIPVLGLAVITGFTAIVRMVRKDQVRRDSDRWNLSTEQMAAIRRGRMWPMNYSSPQIALILLSVLALEMVALLGMYAYTPSGDPKPDACDTVELTLEQRALE